LRAVISARDGDTSAGRPGYAAVNDVVWLWKAEMIRHTRQPARLVDE
jgi:hypothetical protein